MPHLHLPQDHDDSDLVLASQIAASIGSGELFIAWTRRSGAGARPTVAAELREPINLAAEVIEVLFDCAAEFLRALLHAGSRTSRPPSTGAATS